ncbi:MAG: hypothetical protein HGA24_12455, partial [Candidatus Aminicenantes bacterium]|nr:hypothetical protein [Candidatus Aminicenantes bacterium]
MKYIRLPSSEKKGTSSWPDGPENGAQSVAGYAYAHLLTRWLPIRWQGGVHFALLVAALLMLPVVPDETWKPAG